jgi:hypothetical protein
MPASFTIGVGESTSSLESTGWDSKNRVLDKTSMVKPKSTRGPRIAVAVLLSISLAGVAVADPDALADRSTDGDRWIPSLSIFTMGNVEQRQARMSADTPVRQNQGNLDADGQSFGLPWSVGGTLDLSTPVLLEVPGRPRLFAHADVGFTYDVNDLVVGIGDPGAEPVLPANQTASSAIQNIGASVRAEGKPLTFAGGVGPAFEFHAMERGFRFRPTLEWMYRRDTMKTVFGGGESEAPPPQLACIPDCRFVFVRSQTEKGFHLIGPGFEAEADVGRVGDFRVGWYGSFRALYVVRDRKANLRSIGEWQRFDGQPTSRADTEFVTQYEREPWDYRFGMGIRISWLPEE